MMFVTVGTGPRGYDRLVRGVDAIAPEFDEEIQVQIGRGDYVPDNVDWFRFTSEDAIHKLYRTANVVIAHAGAGTLLTALSYEKPIVVLPRREKHGEHNDDHQIELADALRDRPDVFVIDTTDELKPAVEKARSHPGGSTTQSESLVQFLSEYIDTLES